MDLSLDLVEVGFRDADGGEQRVSLAEAARVGFESCAPVRRFLSRKGQRHLSGRWWSATVNGHVGYESWLERDHLMLLDFDPDVAAIASQPFWLFWTPVEGRPRSHAPDYFVRHRDGGVTVIDVRPDERIEPRDAVAFAVTGRVCEQLGWGYRRVGAADAVTTGNVRWLSGYRHPRHHRPVLEAALREVFDTATGLMAGAQAVGDPLAVLPVLFHLLWRHELVADLTVPLHPAAPGGHQRRDQCCGGVMASPGSAVLRPGDWVAFDGEDHQVVALAGVSVRLRSAAGAESVVLVSYLLASSSFAVLDGAEMPGLEPFGLLDGLPQDVLVPAREWQRHIHEVETGLAPDAAAGATPRAGYDPATTTVRQREKAKAAELGVGVRTVARMRARYARQGLWGLVDQRGTRTWAQTGRVDARVVAAAREVIAAETDISTGTRSRLIRRVIAQVEAAHGTGVVALPGRTTLFKLIDTLAVGRHTFGSAVTRRQTANRPAGMFTPSFAARPGEQVQIDSTPIDVMVLLDDGLPVRADLTIAVDVATRTIGAAVLRPVGTKAVDAALLLARMLVPEPMRPGWAAALGLSVSRLPHARLLDIDARMQAAAARPVIVPDTIVIDHGKVFVSDTFTRACDRLGFSVQPCRPGTPTDKAIVETTLGSINTLFCQHVAGYTGPNVTRRGADPAAVWTIAELQDLLDEWLIIGWAHRPHDSLRDPLFPGRAVSPNDRYTALVAAAGYLPLPLSGPDYLELLPVAWRQINAYGIRIDYRTYDSPELGPWRGQHSGNTAKRGLWEVHHDPYDLSQVFVRTPAGWVTAPWTHLPMVSAPFADFTWRHARRLAAQAGRDDTNETEIARVLDELLTRAQASPVTRAVDRATARVAARTRVGAAAHRPPRDEPPTQPPTQPPTEPKRASGPAADDPAEAAVIPLGVFDPDTERWP